MIKLILFGILKGIGILLLVLLLLLLLMVLVVLLSPIRYHLEGEKRAAGSGSFGLHPSAARRSPKRRKRRRKGKSRSR